MQKLWFYVHPTLHTLSLLHGFIIDLCNAEDSASSDSDESSVDPEEEARNEALGLGGSDFKAVLNEIKNGGDVATASGGGGIVMGGEVLAILYDRMQNMGGDPAANTLYKTLIRAAGKPYAMMLDVWMRTGKLNDPYEECCVKESKFIDKGTLEKDYTDEYWERRYTVRIQFIFFCHFYLF